MQTWVASLFVLDRTSLPAGDATDAAFYGIATLFADHLELVLSMVRFGALLGFLSLQISVVAHLIYRECSRDWLRHLVTAAIGFAIIAYVLRNADVDAKLAGAIWMCAGVVFYFALKRLNRPARLPGGPSGTA